jgi:small conductance mechanosensitive channel
MLITENIANLYKPIADWFSVHGLRVIGIIVLAYLAKLVISSFLRRLVRKAVSGGKIIKKAPDKKREKTLINVFNGTVSAVAAAVAGLMILEELGMDTNPVLAAAGVVGIAVGLGGQSLIKDVISGVFILLENQYRIGDHIAIDNISGTVENISLRATSIRDLDGTVFHIPNGEIKKTANMSKDFSRINILLAISSQADLSKAGKAIDAVGRELSADPIWKDQVISAPHFWKIEDFSDSAIVLRIAGEVKPAQKEEVVSELRLRLRERFVKEGIAVPMMQSAISLKK